jgi:hypothetical protein
MDKNTPLRDIPTTAPKPARVALNVLALCFALALIGRGLGESFTVFLKPISEDFGWDRAQIVSVYSLTWLAGGLTAPLIGRLFDHSSAMFQIRSCSDAGSVRGCRPRWRWSIPQPGPAYWCCCRRRRS